MLYLDIKNVKCSLCFLKVKSNIVMPKSNVLDFFIRYNSSTNWEMTTSKKDGFYSFCDELQKKVA